ARGFDLAIIDCPSNLGLLTVNALTAANGVIIPTFPQVDALRNLWLFLGILFPSFDPRLTHHRAAVEVMQAVRLPLMPIGIKRREIQAKVGEVETEEPTAIYLPNAPEEQAELVEVVERWAAKGQP